MNLLRSARGDRTGVPREERIHRSRWWLTRAVVLVLLLASGLSIAGVMAAVGLFVDRSSVPANAFQLDVLAPPTAVTATSGASIVLTWTPTADPYAAGHRVFRSTTSGGPYTQVAEVTPRTTATYTDTPSMSDTYYYVVRAFYGNWQSVVSSQVTGGKATTTGYRNCTATAAVTTNSGDNNGYELLPLAACADDNLLIASDLLSGTDAASSCTNPGKDRHVFYNYGFSVPAGATVTGIEVALDAWVDAADGSHICVELSWNGGVSWTAARATPALTGGQARYVLGGVADRWGHSWSVGDFSNANFRVRLTDVSHHALRGFQLDWVGVQVHFAPP